MGRKPVTVRIARWSAEHPWRAIAFWVIFVAVAVAGGNAVQLNEGGDLDQSIGEFSRAERIVSAGRFAEPAVEHVLITAHQGALDPAAAAAAAADAAGRLAAVPEVASVGAPVPAPDGSALLVPIVMGGDREAAEDRVQPLLDATKAVQADHPGVRVEQVGGASLSRALNDVLGEDFKRAEFLSLPVTLAILIVAFGALIAAGIPVLLALSSVAAAIGLSTLASHLVPAASVTNSVVLLIGMAVGVDYSLFYLRREREERAKGRSAFDAVEIAAETSGRAVVISGFAVIISMAGLFLADDAVFSSLAVGSILVVAVAVLGSLTVLPALLAKLGRWVDRPRVPLLWRLTAPRMGADGRPVAPRFWPAVLRPALRHPLITFVLSAGLLVALAVPALGMKLKLVGLEDLPRSIPAMQAYDRMTAAFPGTGTRHVVAVQTPAGQAEAIEAALTGLAVKAGNHPLFAPVPEEGPKIEVSADGRVAVLQLATPYASGSDEAVRSLGLLRGELVPAALGPLSGVEYAVGGDVAVNVDYTDHIRGKLPLVMGFVLLLTFVAMALTFRSVVIALMSIVLNLLSAGAAYGLLTLVFQKSWAEELLDFTSMGAIVTWLPLFLFVILFGLSMDYHVFVVSRIREAVRRGVHNREAVAEGITRSAGVVSSAAIVMVGVFSIFAALSSIDMKQIGVGLAVAILLDATLIRAVVLPSLMALLGDANWWAPRFLRERSVGSAPVEPSKVVEAEALVVG
ncbi:MAG TPA: MMPL family transporter [Micromonosporaceae bacterium]|nr:MMPL family transporter [Micromonosporaceae bacterium]